jgi:small GTP-binding protein
MITRKIAMVGHWGVGKTSLVKQFVSQQFSEKYLATLGVKIDKKVVELDDQTVSMVLWDIAGAEDDFSIPMHYIKGAAAFLLVVDGTRPESLVAAQDLVKAIHADGSKLPFVMAVNKADLEHIVSDEDITNANLGDDWLRTSAKTGEGVEDVFKRLAKKLL